MNKPIVSVCVPAYNAEAHIEACIASVIESDYSNLEIVVSDDASTDSTVEKIKQFNDSRLLLRFNESNLGRAQNIRSAVETSTGSLITILPSDCALPRDSISRRVIALNERPDAVFVYGAASFIGAKGVVTGLHQPFTTQRVFEKDAALGSLLPSNPVYPSTCLFTRDAYLRAGGLRVDSGPSHRDWDLFLRMSALGSIVYLADPVALEGRRPEDFSVRAHQSELVHIFELVMLQQTRSWVQAEYPGLIDLLDQKISRWANIQIAEAILAKAGLVDRTPSRALGLALVADPTSGRRPRFVLASLLQLIPTFITKPLLRNIHKIWMGTRPKEKSF